MLQFSWKTLWIFQILAILGIQASREGWWDGVNDQELEDEKRDPEIYRAVVNSMKEWEAIKNNRTRHKRAESNICYPEIGCFEGSGAFSYLETLPSPPNEVSTTFLLYPGRRQPRSVTLGDAPLLEVPFSNLTDAFDWASKHFNSSKPTKVLVHGFGSSCHYVWVYEMRSALMAIDDCNIVCVDWEQGATLPNYMKAAANTRLVGKQLALLLRGLEKHAGLSRSTMHLIGFSLGAHVAGFAGSEMKNISRITGLDPAGPLFETQDPAARLDSSDATFVDVIHSNGENLFLGGLGAWQPMGHVDFYPNGGRMQKGCSNLFVGAVSDFIWSSEVEGRSLCNHRRAYKFFLDSVSPRCHFPAFPCESYEAFLAGKCFPCTAERRCGNMGYYADKSVGRGQLYLITRDEEPFCAHQYNVKIESSPMVRPVTNYGNIKITLIGDADLNETFTMTNKDDEQLIPGHSVSRILVPHPIISEPRKVQILYTGYSGWLSSGFRRWKIDKVSMMDSFGKTSSVCINQLELESGIPVILRLYPGDCNIPKDRNDNKNEEKNKYIDDRMSEDPQLSKIIEHISNTTNEKGFIPIDPSRKFIPTPVVRIGNEAIKEGIKKKKEAFPEDETEKQGFPSWNSFNSFGNPGKNDINLEDSLEIESNRAFNTKVINNGQNDANSNKKEEIKEIVEPILKKSSNKNARSHDITKPEITEPILGPTTSKNLGTTSRNLQNLQTSKQPNLISKLLGEKEVNYNFYEVQDENDWVPSENSRKPNDGKYLKRHDYSQTISIERVPTKEEGNPLKMIMMTVQFLPQRLSKMFEQAEKYARETIFPFISQHTPKIFSNFINRDNQPKYLPLDRDEINKRSNDGKKIIKTDFTPPDIPVGLSRTDNENSENVAENLLENSTEKSTEKQNTTSPKTIKTTSSNLPHHVMKIAKVNDENKESPRSNFAEKLPTTTEKVVVVYAQNYENKNSKNDEQNENKNKSTDKEEKKIGFSQIPPNSKVYYDETTTNKVETTSMKIYIDLPVFDERDIGPKYIPLVYPDSLKSEKITRR